MQLRWRWGEFSLLGHYQTQNLKSSEGGRESPSGPSAEFHCVWNWKKYVKVTLYTLIMYLECYHFWHFFKIRFRKIGANLLKEQILQINWCKGDFVASTINSAVKMKLRKICDRERRIWRRIFFHYFFLFIIAAYLISCNWHNCKNKGMRLSPEPTNSI